MGKKATNWLKFRGDNVQQKVEFLSAVLKHASNFLENDKFVVPSPQHECWQNIADDFNKTLNVDVDLKWIYTQVCCDRRNLLKDLKNELHVIEGEDCDAQSDVTAHSISSLTNSRCVTIPYEKWLEIEPECHKWGKEERYSLKTFAWTHALAEAISNQLSLPCAFSFKRSKVSVTENAQYFCKLVGNCSECDTILTGIIPKEPNVRNGDVQIDVVLTGGTNRQHFKKRVLSGVKRKWIQSLDTGRTSSTVVRNQLASKVMKLGDKEPPTLPKGSTIRQAFYEKRKSERLSSNYFQGVLEVKKEIPNYIHDVGQDKFFVHFWSSAQLDICRKLFSEKHSSLHIDATGRTVSPASGTDGSTSPVFYYVGTTSGIPVVQMLSARHHTPGFTFWLMSWIRDLDKLPHTVVTDNSLVMMQGCSISFNGISLKHYINICYDCLRGEGNMARPKVWLRLDCVHIVKLVSKLPFLVSANRLVKKFFMHAACQLITTTNLENAIHIFTLISVVSQCECETNECKKATEELKTIIAGDEFENTSLVDDCEIGDSCALTDNDACVSENKFSVLGSAIIEKYGHLPLNFNIDENEAPNPYFQPDLPSALNNIIFSKLPMATAVMAQFYNSSVFRISNSEVESHHKFVKCQLFADSRLPTTPDIFLQRFHTNQDGLLKLKAAEEQNEVERVHSISNTREHKKQHEVNTLHMVEESECEGRDHDVSHKRTNETSLDQFRCLSSVSEENRDEAQGLCVVCHLPAGGAHRCSGCKEVVHVFCGVGDENEEGYGQMVVCFNCSVNENPCKEQMKHVNGSIEISEEVNRPTDFSNNGNQEEVFESLNSQLNKNFQALAVEANIMRQKKNENYSTVEASVTDKNMLSPACYEKAEEFQTCSNCKGRVNSHSCKNHIVTGVVASQNQCCRCSQPLVRSIHGDLQAVEDWRGEVSSANNSKRTYFDPNTEWINPGVHIKIIRNGNFLKPVRFPKMSSICVKNTCSFDSLFTVICCAFLDSVHVQECEDWQLDDPFVCMVTNFCEDQNVITVYKQRAAMIHTIFRNLGKLSHVVPTILVYDCFMTLNYMSLKVTNFVTEWTRQCTNPNCPGKEENARRTLLTIECDADDDVRDLEIKVIASLRTREIDMCFSPFPGGMNVVHDMPSFAIFDESISRRSVVCSGRASLELTKLPSVLLLDIGRSKGVGSKGSPAIDRPIAVSLRTIPLILMINGKRYTLRGVIQEKSSHYVAFCRRRDGRWQKADDMAGKVVPVKSTIRIDLRMCVYSL